MKILLLQKMIYVPSFGGANKGNRLLMEGLAQRGHKCRVIVPAIGSHGPQTREQLLEALKAREIDILTVTPEICIFRCHGVQVHAVFSAAGIYSYAEQRIKEFQPDWVLVTAEDPGQTLLESALRCAPDRTVYIALTPLQMPFGPACFLPSTAQTELIRRAAGIITISNHVKEYIRHWSGLDSTVLRFPVYGPGPFRNLGCFERGFVTLINPCAYKGISIFLDLAEGLPDVSFAVVPTWGTTSGDHMSLRRFPNITLLPPADDIDEILVQTRVLLMPSLWMEAFGLLSVEAMLRGIPVLASNTGGLPEAKLGVDYVLPVHPIEQYEPRFDERDYPVPVIPPQNSSPWKQTLQELLSHRTTYQRVSEESRRAALDFVSQAGVEAFEQFLSCLEKVKGTPEPAADRFKAEVKAAGNPTAPDSGKIHPLSLKRQTLLQLRAIRAMRKSEQPSIPRLSRGSSREGFPLSYAQERLWFLDQLRPGNIGYQALFGLGITGRLDAGVLERSLNEIVRRHEILRTSFHIQAGEPRQVITAEVKFELPIHDLQNLSPDQRAAELQRTTECELEKSFDLTCAPLIRAGLVRFSETEHVLLYGMHHIISDGWSMSVVVQELSKIYEAFARGEPSPLPELPIQYVDFAVWQRNWLQGEVLEKQLEYWREQLKAMPEALELPTDRPRPAMPSHHGSATAMVLSKELSLELKKLSQRQGVTLFMTLLAGWKVLLYRHTGQDDVVVGTPIANRNRREIEALIGFFVNTLVIRTDLSGNPTFLELLDRERKVTLDAYEHQDIPFERLVQELQPERNLSYNPLFQVFFNLANLGEETLEIQGLQLSTQRNETASARFDLTLYVNDVGEQLRLELVYSTDLFAKWRMDEFLNQYHLLLTQLVEAPQTRIADFTLVSERMRKTLPQLSAKVESRWKGGVHEFFSREARRCPEAVAVMDQAECWNYAELDKCANQLANYLRIGGLKLGDRVAIYGSRSAGLILALIGVLKASGSFVILDQSYPESRLKEYVRVVQPRACILLDDAGARQPAFDRYLTELADCFRLVLPATRLDLMQVLGACSSADPELATDPEQECYLAFTSGTTGVPKGIIGTHSPLAHFIAWHAEQFGLMEGDRFSLLSGLSHDPLLRDIFAPLSVGARICIPDEPGLERGDLGMWMKEAQVSVAHLTPALGRFICAGVKNAKAPFTLDSLRYAFFGGDLLTRGDIQQLKEIAPSVQCVNFYGTTETPQAMSYYRILGGEREFTKDLEQVPIGAGIEGVDVVVLNRSAQPAGVGELGEIWIRTPYLSSGYLNDPALTQERFRRNWFGNGEEDRMYKTGDWGRYLPDGNIEYWGRMDHQVKVRGFRIELGEIESVLRQHSGVNDAAVITWEDKAGDKQLAGYVVGKEMAGPGDQELRRHVREKLPEYMVPSVFVMLERIPLTPNGKVDRKALPAPERKPEEGTFVAPQTPTEELLVGIYKEVLKVERVGVNENFFELGGHSLLATQLISRVRKVFKVELPLKDLFEAPTVASLGERVAMARQTGSGLQAPPIMPSDRNSDLPLSFAQERLWFLDQLEPGSPTYNAILSIPGVLRIGGVVHVKIFEQALNEIIRRHEVLRTTFGAVDGRPIQVIQPVHPTKLPVIDLENLLEQDQADRVLRLAEEEAQRPFNLKEDLMVRFQLLRLNETRHVMLYTLHHIASDGWSMRIFIEEFVELYKAFLENKTSPLTELPVQYADFAIWQREWLQGEVLANHLSYWKKQLGERPTELQLPTDRPRVTGQRSRLATQSIIIPAALTRQLNQLSQREGVTLFMTLLAAFNALLSRYAQREEIAVGTFVANRNRSEVEQLIGFFVNILMLYTNLSGDPDFKEILKRVRTVALEAYAHQDLPFQKLVAELQPERSMTHSPLYQVMLVLHNTPVTQLQLPGLILSPIKIDWKTANLDLHLSMSETKEGLVGLFEYDPELFEAQTIMLLEENYRGILEQVAEDAERKLSQLQLTAGLVAKLKTHRTHEEKPAIVLAATFTANPLEESLKFWMSELDISTEIKWAPYNQVLQQLLDLTSLQNTNRLGVNVVLIRIEDLQRFKADEAGEIRKHVLEFAAAVKAAAGHSPCSYIVGICPGSPLEQRLAFFHEMEALMASEIQGVKSLCLIRSSEWNQAYPITEFYDRYGDELGHVPYTSEFFTVMGTMLARKCFGIFSVPYKVIVLDCDQTLWTGICAEDGVMGITIDPARQALQRFMLDQKDAGKLLCLCSKNDETDVAEVFRCRPEMCLKRDDIVAWRINWESKSENLKSLAEELGLGLDSFIFMDDNPVECAEVAANCPQVLVLELPGEPEAIGGFLRHLWVFDRRETTEEDKKRTQLYRENAERERLRKDAPSFEVFLAGLELHLEIAKVEPDQLFRVAQLTQRTNQFNATSVRRSETELEGLLRTRELECLVVKARDRFGDYGLIGVMLFKAMPGVIGVDTFLLSCRVLGKGIEHRMLAKLCEVACERGLNFVEIEYRPTGKNQPVLDFLKNLGSPPVKQQAGCLVFKLVAKDLVNLRYVPVDRKAVHAASAADGQVAMAQKASSGTLTRIALELSEVKQIQQALESYRRQTRVQPVRGEYAAPRTPSEKTLAEIWSTVLGIERVGIFDNFFDLGGHSLLATQVISRVRDVFQVEIPLQIIFTTRFTIEELAKVVTQYQMEKVNDKDIAVLLDEINNLSDEEAKAAIPRKT
ncbi:MAG: amino acid adenylation domain-containing protein [Verrucomicrobiota bacterium]|jgi:amino acid adenylation domain-containing protein/FkbH-like protein